jgi:uncharacterized membrane protein YcjF (UPF0283 family)
MNVPGVNGLIGDIEFAFGLPIVVYLMFLLNLKFGRYGRFKALLQRLSLTFVLLLFATDLIWLMLQDRTVLKALWQENSVFYSLAYSVSSVLVIAGVAALAYWKLRPELWRRKEHESDI